MSAVSVGEVEALFRLRDELSATLSKVNQALATSEGALSRQEAAFRRSNMAMAAMHEQALKMDAAYTEAAAATGKWTEEEQRAAMAMAASHEQALALNRAMDEAAAAKGKWTDEDQRAAQAMARAHDEAKKLNAEFDRTSGTLHKASTALQDAGSKMTGLGHAMLPISAGIAAIGFGVGKAAIDFESSFAGVRKTVDGTDAEIDQLAVTFRKLATEIPVSVNELNAIAEAGGQLGVATEDLVGFTRTMADMGVATNLTSDAAATGMAQIANIMDNVAGPSYDRMGATIVDLGNKGASTEAQILEFGLRLAGAGKVANMTEAEVLGIGSALASVGINAEAGGTAFSKLIADMANAASNGAEGLHNFAAVAGKSAEEFKKIYDQSSSQALVLFIEGLGKMKDEGHNLFGVLSALGIEEARMRDAILRSAGAGDLLSKSIQTANTAWKENSALTTEAEKRYATTASQLQVLWNKVTDIAITLGQELMPALQMVVDTIEELLPYVQTAVQWFGELPEPIQLTIIGLLAIAAAAGPVLIALGTMATAVGTLGITLAGAGAALGTVAAAAAVLAASYALTTWFVENTRVGQLMVDMLASQILMFTELAGITNLSGQSADTKGTGAAGFGTQDFKNLEEWQKAMAAAKANVDATAAANAKLAESQKDVVDVFEQEAKKATEANSKKQQHKLLTDEQKKAAEAAAKAFQGLVDQYRASSTEAGRTKAAQDQVKVILAAIGPLAKASGADIHDAVTKLKSMGEEGAAAGKALYDEWSKLAGLEPPSGEIFGPTNEELGYTAVLAEEARVKAEDLFIQMQNGAVDFTEAMVPVVMAMTGLDEVATRALLGAAIEFKDTTDEAKTFAETMDDVNEIIGAASDLLDVLGISAESALGKGVAAAQEFGQALSKGAEAAAAWAEGDYVTAISKGIGAVVDVVQGFTGLFGDKEHEKVNDLRDAYVAAAGGITALDEKARAAGMTVDELLAAKKVEAFEAAVRKLEAAFDFQAAEAARVAEAHEKTNAAIEKYGFTIEELGPKWQQQDMEAKVSTLYEDFQLLVASGIDVADVIKRMGPELQAVADQSKATGVAIPANMKPIYEEMIRQGQLLDENGKAYESLEETGLTFTESLTEGMQKLVASVQDLVNALLGVRAPPPIHIPITYDEFPGSGGGGPAPPKHHGGEEYDVGGLARGPSTGYGATLHGEEYVLPRGPGWMRQLAGELAAVMPAGAGSGGPVCVESTNYTYLNSQQIAMSNSTSERRREGRRPRA